MGVNQEKNLSPSSNSRYKLSTSYPSAFHQNILLQVPCTRKAYTALPVPMPSHLVPVGWVRPHGWLYADAERKAWWQQPCKQCLLYQVGSWSKDDWCSYMEQRPLSIVDRYKRKQVINLGLDVAQWIEYFRPAPHNSCVEVHSQNWEVEVEFKVQGHSLPQNEFKTSLTDRRSCLNKKEREKGRGQGEGK